MAAELATGPAEPGSEDLWQLMGAAEPAEAFIAETPAAGRVLTSGEAAAAGRLLGINPGVAADRPRVCEEWLEQLAEQYAGRPAGQQALALAMVLRHRQQQPAATAGRNTETR